MLQGRIVVDRHTIYLPWCSYAPLLLLHHMPSFMRKVLFLPRPDVDVRALPPEVSVRLDRTDKKQVSGWAAASSGPALAFEADLLPVCDTGRYLDFNGLFPGA